VRVGRGEVVDDDRAAVEPADQAAAGLHVHLPAPVLDREGAVAGARSADRRDRHEEREEREQDHGSADHARSIPRWCGEPFIVM
jgi:hypothetical protein